MLWRDREHCAVSLHVIVVHVLIFVRAKSESLLVIETGNGQIEPMIAMISFKTEPSFDEVRSSNVFVAKTFVVLGQINIFEMEIFQVYKLSSLKQIYGRFLILSLRQ